MNTITSRLFISAATVLWVASVQGAAPKGPQSCVVEEIQVPRPRDALADPISINKSGDVAGSVGNSLDSSWRRSGFFNRNGDTTFLPPETVVNGANEAGTLIGNAYVPDSPSGFPDYAFKWVNGKFTILPKPSPTGVGQAYANGINASELIVGTCDSLACYWDGAHLEAHLLGGLDWSYALAVNNAGVIVGSGHDYGNLLKCAKWVAGKLTVLPSGDSVTCEASTINNRGEIAGRISEDGQGYRAVMWRGDVMSYLGGESDIHLRVHDISDSGVVVGSGLAGALYWRNGKQYRLNDLDCVQQSGWNLVTANSISSAGVVGVGAKPGGGFVPYRLRRAFNE